VFSSKQREDQAPADAVDASTPIFTVADKHSGRFASRPVARGSATALADPVTEPVVDEQVADEPVVATAPVVTEPVVTEPVVVEPAVVKPAVVEPVTPDEVKTEPRVRRGHVSIAAALSLMTGTAGLLVAFTGLLAPVGVVLGALAVVLGIFGFLVVGQNNVSGGGVALFGLILGLGALVVGVLVMSGELSWLSSHDNAVTTIRTWLDAHASWFSNW
jgi:hypothetical protein